jgi:hypothetical protein
MDDNSKINKFKLGSNFYIFSRQVKTKLIEKIVEISRFLKMFFK